MVYKKLNENVHGLSQKACRHQQNKELPQWLFFETIIRAFQWERESFWAIRVPPPLSPNCWLKELDEVSNSKFFTKNIMIKNAILRHLIYLRDHYKNDQWYLQTYALYLVCLFIFKCKYFLQTIFRLFFVKYSFGQR